MVSKSYRPQRIYQTKVKKSLENIYISPSEICNLACHACYTQKTPDILSNTQILNFVKKYNIYIKSKKFRNRYFLSNLNMSNPHSPETINNDEEFKLRSILFCGGEVFLLPKFTTLINKLIDQGIFITIITNGTIDKLSKIKKPSNCQLIVSLDGPKDIHDSNRGQGNFSKSTKFISKALSLGFPVEIFYLVTAISYPYIKSFNYLNLPITYLTDRLGSLTPSQVLDIKTNYPTYPSKDFGCYQLALQSNGFIYGCCESSIKLSHISDPPQTIVDNFVSSLVPCFNCKNFDRSNVFLDAQSSDHLPSPRGRREHPKKSLQGQERICFGCCDPKFLCGYTKELNCQNCQQTVKLINKQNHVKD